MINNQNLAVLSEKVAALEAAIKEAGIELPSVTTDDNGKTLQVVAGKWATGNKIPGVVNALDSTSTTDALSAAQGKALNESTIKNFDTWESVENFSENNDTWTATDDGFLSVQATNVGATSGTYCYIYDSGVSSVNPVTSIALPSGGAGLSYGFNIPVVKGNTYKLVMGGAIQAVAVKFVKFNY